MSSSRRRSRAQCDQEQIESQEGNGPSPVPVSKATTPAVIRAVSRDHGACSPAPVQQLPKPAPTSNALSGRHVLEHPQIHEVLYEFCTAKDMAMLRVVSKRAAQFVIDYGRDVLLMKHEFLYSNEGHYSSFHVRFLASCDFIADILAGECVAPKAIPYFFSLLMELESPPRQFCFLIDLAYYPVRKTIESIASGTAMQVQALINAGLARFLHHEFMCPRPVYACAIVALVAKHQVHIDWLLRGWVQQTMTCMRSSRDLAAVKAAVRAVASIPVNASRPQMQSFVDEGGLRFLCDHLRGYADAEHDVSFGYAEDFLHRSVGHIPFRFFRTFVEVDRRIVCYGAPRTVEGITAERHFQSIWSASLVGIRHRVARLTYHTFASNKPKAPSSPRDARS